MESKFRVKNQYTSSILKVQLNDRLKNNVAVAEMTFNNVRTLEILADDIKKTKSMMEMRKDTPPSTQTISNIRESQKKMRQIKTTYVQDNQLQKREQIGKIEEEEVEDDDSDFNKFLASDSESIASTDNIDVELYNQSVLISTAIKKTEQLIDTDLINLLKFIRQLKQPDESHI